MTTTTSIVQLLLSPPLSWCLHYWFEQHLCFTTKTDYLECLVLPAELVNLPRGTTESWEALPDWGSVLTGWTCPVESGSVMSPEVIGAQQEPNLASSWSCSTWPYGQAVDKFCSWSKFRFVSTPVKVGVFLISTKTPWPVMNLLLQEQTSRSFMYSVTSLVCELQCWKEVLITEDNSDIVK